MGGKFKKGRSDKVVSLAIDDWTGKKAERSADALSGKVRRYKN